VTDAERELLDRLIAAAWPLPWQAALGCALAAGYLAWSRLYYAALDPRLRRAVGGAVGARVVWVRRHSADYPTPFELGGVRRPPRWSWGIAAEGERSWGRDAAVSLLCVLLVNVAAGLWPAALVLYAFAGARVLSYAVFLPTCLAAIAIYSVFWTGRYAVASDN
jgi:hypothetical protein